MNIILTGMKHCGKSTHGFGLAKYYNINFFDTDDLIILDYEKNTGNKSDIREIFKDYGEDNFTLKEEEIFSKLSSYLSHNADSIIALGGRLPLNDKIKKHIKRTGLVVFIEVPIKALYERVSKKGIPPFLDPENPEKSFYDLYQERKKHYFELADIVVKVDNASRREVLEMIINKIEEYNDAR